MAVPSPLFSRSDKRKPFLYITRGRDCPIVLKFWQRSEVVTTYPVFPVQTLTVPSRTPQDISTWTFSHALSPYLAEQAVTPAVTGSITNLADGTQGQLMYHITADQTDALTPGKYFYEVVTIAGGTRESSVIICDAIVRDRVAGRMTI